MGEESCPGKGGVDRAKKGKKDAQKKVGIRKDSPGICVQDFSEHFLGEPVPLKKKKRKEKKAGGSRIRIRKDPFCPKTPKPSLSPNMHASLDDGGSDVRARQKGPENWGRAKVV